MTPMLRSFLVVFEFMANLSGNLRQSAALRLIRLKG
jgi:hypothetical protein